MSMIRTIEPVVKPMVKSVVTYQIGGDAVGVVNGVTNSGVQVTNSGVAVTSAP